MTLVEWLGVITGVVTVWLAAKNHIANWPIGIANSAFFLALFWPKRLYADSGLQVVYIVLGFYGWWGWKFGGKERTELPISRTPRREFAWLIPAAVSTFVGIAAALQQWTDSDVPYWDAFPTTASLVAQYLLTRRYLANWAVWIFGANLPFMALYVYKGLSLIAALQIVFIALSVQGWIAWRKEITA